MKEEESGTQDAVQVSNTHTHTRKEHNMTLCAPLSFPTGNEGIDRGCRQGKGHPQCPAAGGGEGPEGQFGQGDRKVGGKATQTPGRLQGAGGEAQHNQAGV